MSGFSKFPREHAIIGRLLTRYSDLELDLFNCVQVASSDFNSVFRAMFERRGGKERINTGAKLGGGLYERVGLKADFDRALNAMRRCLEIRNQYSHCVFWVDCSGKLAVGALEEIVQSPKVLNDLMGLNPFHVDVDLLKGQESYFVYVSELLAWVNFEGRCKTGSLASNPVVKPKHMIEPPLNCD